jgi:hypothetical protein
MIFDKPDGRIELANSSCCCPPGPKHAGMHTNAGTTWWRVVSEEWRDAWHPLRGGMSNALVLARAANSCDEFVDAMERDL